MNGKYICAEMHMTGPDMLMMREKCSGVLKASKTV